MPNRIIYPMMNLVAVFIDATIDFLVDAIGFKYHIGLVEISRHPHIAVLDIGTLTLPPPRN